MSRIQGDEAESLAACYLESEGLSVVCKNYQAVCGEIDLICEDKSTLIFVEVRYRANPNFGGALSSVTTAKQQKLIRTAKHYLVTKGIYDKMPCRFDVVCLDGSSAISWIKDAFSA